MAQITTKPITDSSTWEKFMSSRSEANFLHSWNWGKFHHELGKSVQRTGFYLGEKLEGVMLSIVEKAKRATYLTVPGGPLINWRDKDAIAAFQSSAVAIAKDHGCSFVRVRPQLLENKESSEIFAGMGFRLSPMHLHAELTHQLDLTESEVELLSSMRKSTRYEIKRGQKLGIKVSSSTDQGQIEDFYRLQLKTAKRHGFVPFSLNFLAKQFEVFSRDGQAMLYSASLKDKLLTQAIIIVYGHEADYHYAASTEANRKYPGSYLLQWEAIKEAKRRGMSRYNLWGVAPEGAKHHRFYGVSVFKRGFRGKDVEYLHARDLVINPAAYSLNWAIELARKKLRKV